MLKGQMIALPFIMFIFFNLFGYEDALITITSIASIAGLLTLLVVTRYRLTKRTLLIEVLAFLLLCVPIIERLISAPLVLFNYALFIIPLIGFVLFFVIYLTFTFNELKKKRADKSLGAT
jgi:O-antigen/teichoic acid export membrane protein